LQLYSSAWVIPPVITRHPNPFLWKDWKTYSMSSRITKYRTRTL